MIPTSIDPIPGFMVFVHYVNGEVVLRQEFPVLDKTPEAEARVTAQAAHAGRVTQSYVNNGEPVTLHVYDGDTGALVGSAIADRHGRRRLS